MKNVSIIVIAWVWLSILAPADAAVLVNGVDQSGGSPHFQALFTCEYITEGVCFNLTDHKLYRWNGSAVIEFTGTGDDLGTATYATVRALWGAGTGLLKTDGTIDTNSYQLHDADLDYLAGQTLSANVRSLLGSANYAAMTGLPYVVTESDPTALLTAGTDNVKDTHIDWGSGAGQVGYADIIATWTTCGSGYLKYDGTCDTPATGATNFNDIGDATAAGSIALAGYMQTITSTLNSAGANITLTNTTADLTADVSFIDFKLTDDGDTNGYFLRGYDNAGGDLKWYIGPGGVFYGNGFESLVADGEHYYAAINTTSITATATAGRVSYYNGYHYIADGADWNDYLMSKERMDTFAELDTIVADKALVNKADGAVWLGVHDFGGAITFEIPNSDDPDLGAVGQIALDTDGWLRVYNGSVQYGKPLLETIHVTVIAPNDLADAVRDAFVVWKNTSGMNFVITHWYGEAGTDDTTLNIETTDATGGTNATVDAVEIATDGTAIFTADDGTITAATIADGSRLLLDFDDTDTPTYVKMSIVGYYNGDVN